MQSNVFLYRYTCTHKVKVVKKKKGMAVVNSRFSVIVTFEEKREGNRMNRYSESFSFIS